MQRKAQLDDAIAIAPTSVAPCPLDRLLRALQPGVAWNQARRAIETGKVRVDGRVETLVSRVVRPGQKIEIRMRSPRPRPFLTDEAVAYVDRQVVVVRKPAGLSTVPYDSRDHDTLEQLLERHLGSTGKKSRTVLVVHRLDKDTSGLLVFARTQEAQRQLKSQFRAHTVTRRYLALAEGNLTATTFRSRLIPDRGDGRRGSTTNPRLGREATTHVRPVERVRGATLLECRLETGRTHQIRIHLAEAGHPLVGERVYAKSGTAHRIGAPRIMLHACELGFDHPTLERRLSFHQEAPADFLELVQKLR